MNARDFWRLVRDRYADKPDDYRLSVGHWEPRPSPVPSGDGRIVGYVDLPEFQAYMSVSMEDVRGWAK